MGCCWLAGTDLRAQEAAPSGETAVEPVPAEDELAAMQAAEETIDPDTWQLPDRRMYSAIEGAAPRQRRLRLSNDELVFELGTGWLRHPTDRPGGEAAVATRGLHPAGFDIPVVLNQPVLQVIDFLQGSGSKMFHRWLARTTRYYPIMRPILRKYDLPEDLVAVALIESGLMYKAFSRAKASGPWQFMQSTGQAYGLKVDFWIDERRDFHKATDAAARHLRDLYNRFGDWYLAWAAYNAGENKITRALQRTGSGDFWALLPTNTLHPETKRYVPKIIAAALISRNPERYGFRGVPYEKPLTFEEVEVSGMADLKAAARAVGVDLETIQELNPELRYWCSPPYLKSYHLHIPSGTRQQFLDNYKPAVRDSDVAYTRYLLKTGETLTHVALKYKTSVEAIKAANRIQDVRRIRAGRSLLIPIRPCGNPPPGRVLNAAAGKARKRKAGQKGGRKVKAGGGSYVVQSGDTLWSIAATHKTDVARLNRLNRLKPGHVLMPGDVIRVK
jgi:membrane-bound lytic murein transglycosylase D